MVLGTATLLRVILPEHKNTSQNVFHGGFPVFNRRGFLQNG